MSEVQDEAELWTAVDAYLADHLIAEDEVLQAALRESELAGLPAIQVTALQGRMLQIFARMVEARRILEVGTLGGYSTIWLARALPEGGRLITLEAAAKHAAVARKNLKRAGVLDRVELREGRRWTRCRSWRQRARDHSISFFWTRIRSTTQSIWNGRCGWRGRAR